MKTYLPKKMKESQSTWVLFDAKDQIVGQLAVKIANALRGKDKVDYTPHLGNGAKVVVVNAKKVKFSGQKEEKKEYISHSGYMGGRHSKSVKEIREKDASMIIRSSVKGMMPRNKLSHSLLSNLYVYNFEEHSHKAQNPKKF